MKIYKPSYFKPRDFMLADNITVGQFCFVAPRFLEMGDGSQLAPGAKITGGGNVYIGKNVAVGFNAILIPATDTKEGKSMNEAGEGRDVIRGSIFLGDGVYVGSGAIICVSRKCPHIVVGIGAVIGAGCYIDDCVPPFTVTRPSLSQIRTRRYRE